MTIHKSLTLRGRLQRSRNVLTRWERIQRMQTEDKWPDDGRSVFGLPKIAAAAKVKKKVKKKKKDEEEAK